MCSSPLPWFAPHVLSFALAWTVFVNAGLGIIAPGFAAAIPEHSHFTLNGFVPPHVDLPAAGVRGQGIATCATVGESDMSNTDIPSRVACAQSSDSSPATGSLLAATGPVARLGAAGVTIVTAARHAMTAPVRSLLVPTPPPRG